MDVHDLRVFESVARLGSMNRAAVELHMVQSNVTARVRALEGDLGLSLFDRHAKGVAVTEAGQRLRPYARQVFLLLAEARAATVDRGEPQGALVFGTLETTAALRLSPILSAFARRFPNVDLTVTTGTSSKLTQEVLEGGLEGAFVAGPILDSRVSGMLVFEEELVLATARSITDLSQLSRTEPLKTIVFHAGCSYRQTLETWMTETGLPASRPMEFGSLDTIISCVSAGIGASLLPRAILQKACDEGLVNLHRLPDKFAKASTFFITRTGVYQTSALRSFLALCRPTASGRGLLVPSAISADSEELFGT